MTAGMHRAPRRHSLPLRWLRAVASAFAAAFRWIGELADSLIERVDPDVVDITLPGPAPQVAAPASITNPVVPATVADIDYRDEPLAIPARTTATAHDAVLALHQAYPGLPDPIAMPWRYFDDGAQLNLDSMPVSSEQLRGTVAVYAAALAVPVEERPKEGGSGHVVVSLVGEYRGLKVGVQATCVPDPDAGLDRVYQEFRAEDDTQAFAPVVDVTGPHALQAPQGAA